MADVLTTNQSAKRKPEEDSEDELYFKFEQEKKLKNEECLGSSGKKEVKNNDDKENIKGKKEDTKVEIKNENSTNTASPSQKTKSAVQTKLSFKPLQTESPKPKVDTQTKQEIAQKPNDGEWEIQEFLYDEKWKRLLSEEFSKKYFIEINRIIREGYKKNIVRPPKELVFNALNSTSIDNIKCVIIGQDPYHDDGQAHGLAFSVPKGIALPPSLRNIFIELKNDIPDFKRDEKLGGCLQQWADQGVFMLNTFLTVEAHKAGSHSKIGWDIFTDKVIKLVSENNTGCAFLLWGNFAQKKETLIDKKKHKVIKCAHPSPFSCQRFFNSKCFSQANEYLKSIDKTPVNWSLN